jgi:hypothetical protein
MRQDQENNTVAYYKQITNTLLYKAIIELRAFCIAFIVIINIRSYFRIILLLI